MTSPYKVKQFKDLHDDVPLDPIGGNPDDLEMEVDDDVEYELSKTPTFKDRLRQKAITVTSERNLVLIKQ